MSLLTRVTKLEVLHQASGEIPVWCDQLADMPGAISEMIADGEITESDRPRCVYWAEARSSIGAHETSLSALATP